MNKFIGKAIKALKNGIATLRNPKTITDYIWLLIWVFLIVINIHLILMCIGAFVVCCVVTVKLSGTDKTENKQIKGE